MEENTINTSLSDTGYQFDDAMDSSQPMSGSAGLARGDGYAHEIFTKTIHAKFRTFYIDVKESRNGRFLKISEKSNGRKSTVMMDAEDVPKVIEAMEEAKGKL